MGLVTDLEEEFAGILGTKEPRRADTRTKASDAQRDAEARERGRLAAQAEAARIRDAQTLADLEHALGSVLGPLPQTAQEWADRGARVAHMALLPNGPDPRAAQNFEAMCKQRAAWLDPDKFGTKPQSVTIDIAGVLDAARARYVRLSRPEQAAIEGEVQRAPDANSA